MNRFSISSIIKYLFIILIIGFFIILLLPEEKKTSKIEEKPESTEVEKNIKKILPACVAKPPRGSWIVKFFKYPGYLKEAEKCRRLRKSKLLDKKSVVRPEKKLESKKTTEILTPKGEVGINNDN